MKLDPSTPRRACSPSVLTASTAFEIADRIDEHDLPHSPSAHSARPGHPRFTQRRLEIVSGLLQHRVLTADQIRTWLYPSGGASRCQYDLTLLYRHRWIDRLARQSVNEPYVYLLSRYSVAGNRQMREQYGEAVFRHRMHRLGSIPHLIGVNDVRVRVDRACRELGWILQSWMTPEDLAPQVAGATTLLSDGYWSIERPVGGQVKTSGFALELQRSVRSSTALSSKLERYARFYYSGAYAQVMGTPALRVLVVFTDELGVSGNDRARRAFERAAHQRYTLPCFTSLSSIRSHEPKDLLTAPIWYRPGRDDLIALFDDIDNRPNRVGGPTP